MPIPSGALRFNSDSGKLEYYNGEVWWQIDNFSADNATGGTRGIFSGGYITASPTGTFSNRIDFVIVSWYPLITPSMKQGFFPQN